MPFDVGQSPTPPENPMMQGGGGPAPQPGGNPMMPQQQGAPPAPQMPQINPAQAAEMRLHMQVTGQAIAELQADPNAGPKQAIKLIGSIIANNPDHFDANWGATILAGMPTEMGPFRAKIAELAQQQQQLHGVLDQLHPPPSPLAQAMTAHRGNLESLLHKKSLSPKDVAPHLGVEPQHLPNDPDGLRDVLARHYVHAVAQERELHKPIGASN